MQSIYQYAWIIPILPCMSATILGLGLVSARNTTRSQRWTSACLNIGMLSLAMLLSIGIFAEQISGDSAHRQLWSWITVGTLSFQMGYFIDPLSAIMLVLVTTVGVAVMIYTHGYMSHDQGYVRFFAYLSLFTASMLGLILSPNLIQVYVFWELVGMCSYLLVGFWFTRSTAAYACQKAFITNRVGDFGLLLGILGFYWLTGSFEFDIIAQRTHELLLNNSINVQFVTICGILLFLGPIAKSAQFPLHVWLPDAMEGPTPISALIHAATMVAAGVFLVARLLPLFASVPLIMDIIAWTGGITAVLGATIAIAQKDLKKGLAYSTMSQLGYMILALGVGSYGASIFHLITHAYSKALLFLGSGSVIHGLEGVVGYNPNKSQNMTFMGGLRSTMPVTGITFLLGTVSLCGIPPLACFWSKDEILANAWNKMPALGWLAWATAGLTAFYMFRMYFLTFEGNFRGSLGESPLQSTPITKVPHESSKSMVFPLIFLAIPTIFIGLIGAPFPDGAPDSGLLSHWLYVDAENLHEINTHGWAEFISTAFPSVSVALTGAALAWMVYGPHVSRLNSENPSLDPSVEGWGRIILNSIYSWSLRRAYIDEFYEATVVKITRAFANTLCLIDQWAIDGVINVGGILTLLGGEGTRYAEVGRAPAYVFLLAVGLLVFSIFGVIIALIVNI